LRNRLASLVRGTGDPYHLVYVIEHLLVPPPPHDSFRTIVRARTTAVDRLLRYFWAAQKKMQTDMLTMWMEIDSVLHRSEHEELKKTLGELVTADLEPLRAKLKDDNPLYRLGAVQTVHRRRVHLERDLIECLDDSQPLIREGARQALVRLARGADFGPRIAADRLDRKQAARRWQTWLTLQQYADAPAEEPMPADPAEAEAVRLAIELVQVKKEEETQTLERLRLAPEPQGTMALATAIAELKGPRQAKARLTLSKRLSGDDEATLKKRLAHDNPEVRRAAASAVARKKTSALIPDTLKLLEDPEADVAQTARATLKALTGKDFGPLASANSLDRSIAVGQWYRWWVKRKVDGK
jgi:hypothetical protein